MNDVNKAAVLVLIEEASDSILLTQRSQHLRSHPGEVCFPGGKYELSDANLYETALRELHEELLIAPERVQLVKPLLLESTLRGITIQPWLANIACLFPYKANEEVAEVLLVDKKIVLDTQNYKKIQIVKAGVRVNSLQFIYKNYFIWGVTARILYHLANQNI